MKNLIIAAVITLSFSATARPITEADWQSIPATDRLSVTMAMCTALIDTAEVAAVMAADVVEGDPEAINTNAEIKLSNLRTFDDKVDYYVLECTYKYNGKKGKLASTFGREGLYNDWFAGTEGEGE